MTPDLLALEEDAYMLRLASNAVSRQRRLLEEIYESTGDKIGGACPVCSTYTHKHWCWYPKLLRVLNKPLDKNDLKFLLEAERLSSAEGC